MRCLQYETYNCSQYGYDCQNNVILESTLRQNSKQQICESQIEVPVVTRRTLKGFLRSIPRYATSAVDAVVHGNDALVRSIPNEYARVLVMTLIFGAVFLIGCAFLVLSGIGCPITFMTGMSCPGCGMTRAYSALMTGDILMALAWHPLFWTVPIAAYLGVFATETRSRRRRAACLVALSIIVAAFLALWVARMATPNDVDMLFDVGVVEDVVHVGFPRIISVISQLF